MRRIIVLAMFGLVLLGTAGVQQAGADPSPETNPSGNIFYYHLTCDKGYGDITIATTNMGAAGQIVDGSGVLVARQVTVQEVVAHTHELLRGPSTFVWGQGQTTSHPRNLVTCHGFTDPYENEFGDLVQTEATYLMLATPRK